MSPKCATTLVFNTNAIFVHLNRLSMNTNKATR